MARSSFISIEFRRKSPNFQDTQIKMCIITDTLRRKNRKYEKKVQNSNIFRIVLREEQQLRLTSNTVT
jgi:hypothetical protein